MKLLKPLVLLLAAALLGGCFQVDDDLTLQADGSGVVRLTLRSSLPEEALSMFTMESRGGGGGPLYPPTSEAEARHFFPPKDFALKVDKQEGQAGQDQRSLVIEARFKDVNALLASPYARAHQLALKLEPGGLLKLQALSGGETLARGAQFKPEGDMEDLDVPGLEDALKKKNEMRFSFRVTLPNPATAANGTRDHKTVTWAAERAKCKDDDEFAGKLAGVLEATCSADGLKFSPVTPPRLGLTPFGQLAAGKAGGPVALPDTNKIAGAARFVPYALQVTRTLDLSGEGGGGRGSQALLTGAVVLPAELAPQRWGQAKLEEALDAKGNSLVPKESEDADSMMYRFNRFNRFGGAGDEDEDAQGDQPAKDTGQKHHVLTLAFKAPDWKVKELARIRGVQELQYLGASEIIKLSNAVPANLVHDMSKDLSSRFDAATERGQVNDPRLSGLGLSLKVQTVMVQSGMTTLALETGGKSALVEVQVFDAEGRPWPTTLIQSDSAGDEEQSAQVLVAGKPKPPFSLALLVGGVGATVNVPILLEKVPLEDKPH